MYKGKPVDTGALVAVKMISLKKSQHGARGEGVSFRSVDHQPCASPTPRQVAGTLL